MTAEEFATAMFKAAEPHGRITMHGNIQCEKRKSMNRESLIGVFRRCGETSASASSEDLKVEGIETCCFVVFRTLAKAVLG